VVKSLGIKAEHLIILPVFLISILIALMNRVKMHREPVPLLFLWLGFIFVVSIRTVFSDEAPAGMAAIAEFINFLIPLLIMFFYFFNFNKENIDERVQLIKIFRLYNLFLVLNAVLIILAIIGINTSAISQFYWKGFVATDSLGNGRFTGIYNQPLESGMAYSIGILGWLYIAEKQEKVKIKDMVICVLLIVGGVASVSKVFILGGFLLFCFGALSNKGIRKSLLKTVFLLTPLVFIAYQLLKEKWSGMGYLMRFLTNDSGNLLYTLTSGRFGGDNTMKVLFGGVWAEHPLIGLGFGQNDVADSQWFQVFGAGGTIGFAMFILFTIVLLWKALEYRFIKDSIVESRLFGSLVILCVIASIGAPVYTLNRSAIVLWSIIGILLAYKNKQFIPRQQTIASRMYLPPVKERTDHSAIDA
jgi:hypothetical protein